MAAWNSVGTCKDQTRVVLVDLRYKLASLLAHLHQHLVSRDEVIAAGLMSQCHKIIFRNRKVGVGGRRVAHMSDPGKKVPYLIPALVLLKSGRPSPSGRRRGEEVLHHLHCSDWLSVRCAR